MWTVIVRDATGNIHSRTQLKTGVISIGRSADCDIVLQSPSVSRLHGRLLVGGGDMLIFSDEQSANGSYIDGAKVTGAVDVGDATIIAMGDFRLELELEGAERIPAGLTSTLIMSPNDVQLIAQGPSVAPKPPPPKMDPVFIPTPPPRPAAPAPAPVASAPPPAQSQAQEISFAKTVIGAGTKSALPGFEFKDLSEHTPRPVEQQPKTLSESITSLLDQQIQGIQSHRVTQQETQRSRSEQLEQQWKNALVASRELQNKLKGNPRVLYFVISRDEAEVSAKLTENSKRGWTNLILSKRHPETGKAAEGTVWLSVFGEDPKPYREPKDALEDFVRRIASKLA